MPRRRPRPPTEDQPSLNDITIPTLPLHHTLQDLNELIPEERRKIIAHCPLVLELLEYTLVQDPNRRVSAPPSLE